MDAVILNDPFCYGSGNCVKQAHDASFVIEDVKVDNSISVHTQIASSEKTKMRVMKRCLNTLC